MRIAKKKVQPVTALRPFEMELREHGFECRERKRFEEECKRDPNAGRWKNPPRFKYKKGSFVILTESIDTPWRTVQKMSNGHVLWHVDFPLEVDSQALLSFVVRS